MKIGILTFHRAHNYGAVLQCYALQEVLKGMGHEVEVIDYRQPNIENGYNHLKIEYIIRSILKVWTLNKYIFTIKKERKALKYFSSFRNNYLDLTNKCTQYDIPMDFDVYVIGSDQLFTIDITKEIDPVYSGLFQRRKNSFLLGYAVSMNKKSIQMIGYEGWHDIQARYKAFSTREETFSDEIYNISRIKFETCVDPTLLTNPAIWKKLSSTNESTESYVVLYEVRKVKTNPRLIYEKAQVIAKQYGLSVIDLSNMDYTVEQWVWYISHAQCVVTTSFHATVLSLIFSRPLYAFCLNDGGDDRYVDVLRKVGASACIQNLDSSPSRIPDLDWPSINKQMELIKQDSLMFLMRNLHE